MSLEKYNIFVNNNFVIDNAILFLLNMIFNLIETTKQYINYFSNDMFTFACLHLSRLTNIMFYYLSTIRSTFARCFSHSRLQSCKESYLLARKFTY